MALTHSSIGVIGCGPSGAAVSLGLQKLGYNVIAINTPRRHETIEGISKRTAETLKLAGLAACLEPQARFTRRLALWNGTATSANQEQIISRTAFDAALLHCLTDAGIPVIPGKVTHTTRQQQGWRVDYSDSSGNNHQLQVDFLIDARGRSASPSRSESLRGPATLALRKHWQFTELQPQSCVLPFRDGWCWLACHQKNHAVIQTFVANDLSTDKEGFEQRYQQFTQTCLQQLSLDKKALRSSSLQACAAHYQLTHQLLDRNFIRIGDCAKAIDPISGHGIYKALCCGLTAVPVVNTLLQKPQHFDLAKSFYHSQLNADFFQAATVGRDFYQLEQRWPDAAFWRERRQWPKPMPEANDPATIELRPVSEHGFIVAKPVLVSPQYPRGIWLLDQVPVVELIQFLADLPNDNNNQSLNIFARDKSLPFTAVLRAVAWLKEQTPDYRNLTKQQPALNLSNASLYRNNDTST